MTHKNPSADQIEVFFHIYKYGYKIIGLTHTVKPMIFYIRILKPRAARLLSLSPVSAAVRSAATPPPPPPHPRKPPDRGVENPGRHETFKDTGKDATRSVR